MSVEQWEDMGIDPPMLSKTQIINIMDISSATEAEKEGCSEVIIGDRCYVIDVPVEKLETLFENLNAIFEIDHLLALAEKLKAER